MLVGVPEVSLQNSRLGGEKTNKQTNRNLIFLLESCFSISAEIGDV